MRQAIGLGQESQISFLVLDKGTSIPMWLAHRRHQRNSWMLKLSLRYDLAKPQQVVEKIAGVPLQCVGIRLADAETVF
jgi:hypothetical protein